MAPKQAPKKAPKKQKSEENRKRDSINAWNEEVKNIMSKNGKDYKITKRHAKEFFVMKEKKRYHRELNRDTAKSGLERAKTNMRIDLREQYAYKCLGPAAQGAKMKEEEDKIQDGYVHTGESKEDHRKRVEKEGPERMREAIAYADEIPGLESDDDEDEEMEEGEEEHGGELDHYLEDPSDDDEGQQTVGNPVGGVLIPAF